jgi:hypothetical protein
MPLKSSLPHQHIPGSGVPGCAACYSSEASVRLQPSLLQHAPDPFLDFVAMLLHACRRTSKAMIARHGAGRGMHPQHRFSVRGRCHRCVKGKPLRGAPQP